MQRKITVDETKAGSKRKLWIIENNFCDGILPYSSFYDGTKMVGNYDCEGFIKFRDISMLTGQEALTIFESFIRAIESLKEHLFFPDDCVISPDTVYLREDFNKVCFIIITNDSPLREEKYLEIMIHYLKTKTTKLGEEYLEKVLKFMAFNPKYQRLVAYLEGLKTDLSFFETK